MAWLWCYVAIVTGAGVVLGMTGGFGLVGFCALHSAGLLALLLIRRQAIANDYAQLRLVVEQTKRFFKEPGGIRYLAAGMLVILGALTLVAALAQPTIMDAVTYHLPRLAHWLQDGKIQQISSADERMNFVAGLPEIVMAWLLGPTREGFRFVVLIQAIGGIMTVGATIGLARQSGLQRSGAILAGGLLFGMANVMIQFTAAQTDLFTTGIFAVSFYLWLAALRRGESSVFGAMGSGLAVGAKGTLFYMAPSAVLWVAWLGWHHRISWRHWQRTLLAGSLGVVLFTMPGLARNWQAYGAALGPADWVNKVHQGFDSVDGQLHKVYWNLMSFTAQNLDPQAQPHGLREWSRSLGYAIVRQLPVTDSYTLQGWDRRKDLTKLFHRNAPDSDVTAYGIIAFLLFIAGSSVAFVSARRRKGELICIWSGGVVLFILFFSIMQQWHPFAYRYWVLASPWVAIVGAWGIEQLPARWKWGLWILVMASVLDVGWWVTTHANQSGWITVLRPQETPGYNSTQEWRKWSEALDCSPEPFTIALPEERPLTAFYRQWPRREVIYKYDSGDRRITAEDFVRGATGWVIVPAARFIGREGKVAASVWLVDGDERNDYSLAAYRTLAPEEKPEPFIYRLVQIKTKQSVTYDILIKTVLDQAVRVTLTNPATCARSYVWTTSVTRSMEVLEAGQTSFKELPSVAAVQHVTLKFDLTDGPSGSELPEVAVFAIERQ